MIWNVEGILIGELLEALFATPSHILKSKDTSVRCEQEIEVADPDEHILYAVDDMGKYTILCGPEGLITEALIVGSVTENILARTLLPVRPDWSIDCLLDVRSVEVDHFSGWRIVSCVHYAQNTPEMRTGVGDMVDVEARVVEQDGIEDIIEDITSLILRGERIRQDGEFAFGRWKSEVFLQVLGISTLIGTLVNSLAECVIEVEQIGPIIDVRKDDHCQSY